MEKNIKDLMLPNKQQVNIIPTHQSNTHSKCEKIWQARKIRGQNFTFLYLLSSHHHKFVEEVDKQKFIGEIISFTFSSR